MELRILAAPLMRSPSPYVSLLSSASRTSSRRHTALYNSSSPSFVCHSCRKFSVRTTPAQQATAKTPPSEETEWEETPTTNTTNISLNSPHPAVDEADIDMLDKAMGSSGTPGVASRRTPHHKGQPSAQKLEYSAQQLGGSSLDDTFDALAKSTAAGGWGAPRQPKMRPGTSSLSNVQFPKGDGAFAFSDPATKAMALTKPRVLQELNIHLSARTGRTLPVNKDSMTDLGTRLRQLDMLVSRNRIRQDVFRQKFHERGGLKRKRLHSERWRKRFKAGFVRTVTRVQELRRKGW